MDIPDLSFMVYVVQKTKPTYQNRAPQHPTAGSSSSEMFSSLRVSNIRTCVNRTGVAMLDAPWKYVFFGWLDLQNIELQSMKGISWDWTASSISWPFLTMFRKYLIRVVHVTIRDKVKVAFLILGLVVSRWTKNGSILEGPDPWIKDQTLARKSVPKKLNKLANQSTKTPNQKNITNHKNSAYSASVAFATACSAATFSRFDGRRPEKNKNVLWKPTTTEVSTNKNRKHAKIDQLCHFFPSFRPIELCKVSTFVG